MADRAFLPPVQVDRLPQTEDVALMKPEYIVILLGWLSIIILLSVYFG